MEERRASEQAIFIGLLREAADNGAKVYSLREIYPDVDWDNPEERHPQVSMQEILYRYGERDYQCIINGTSAYHHRLVGTIHSARPFRRDPPMPNGPWVSVTPTARPQAHDA